jgi:hypothetical protein
VHPHLSGDVGEHFVAVLEFDAEHGVRQRLDDRPFQDDRVFFGLGQGSILLRMDLLHGLKRNAYRNEQRGAAKVRADVSICITENESDHHCWHDR